MLKHEQLPDPRPPQKRKQMNQMQVPPEPPTSSSSSGNEKWQMWHKTATTTLLSYKLIGQLTWALPQEKQLRCSLPSPTPKEISTSTPPPGPLGNSFYKGSFSAPSVPLATALLQLRLPRQDPAPGFPGFAQRRTCEESKSPVLGGSDLLKHIMHKYICIYILYIYTYFHVCVFVSCHVLPFLYLYGMFGCIMRWRSL